MKRGLAIGVVVLSLVNVLPAPARAQGAIIETLEDLRDRPEPPGFRGTLPARVDLSATLPSPGDQGVSGSCTSWGATYAAASQALRRAGLGSILTLSPSFTYNKISHDPLCVVGTTVSTTLDMLRDVGALPKDEFVFDAGWCGRLPTDAELQRAAKYRIQGWARFDATHVEEVKAQLARGVPVIFDVHVNEQFQQFKGDGVFDFPGVINGGGHTMIAIGYDDARRAFRIQNSWGRKWGEGGYAWLSYDFWARNTGVGYAIN
jgi:hypothetical protein